MFPPEKIEEWIEEVEQRPTSAPLIIQFIANRLSELNHWNEQLREENIALRTGKRVQEYEQQIKSLEYQLEILKRQYGGDFPQVDIPATSTPIEMISLMIYDPLGHIARWQLDTTVLEDGSSLGNLSELPHNEEPLRLLVTPSSEELLCVFTSGRIAPLPVASIPELSSDVKQIDWEQVSIPHEPALGDALACLMPISKLALADFLVQVSRRGFMKKIRKALVASIMDNLYIGTGTKLPADQTMDIFLGREADRYVLLSQEGYLQSLTAEMLSFAVEEAVHLNPTDHLVAALALKPEQSVIAMTQIGKAIHRTAESIPVAEALKRKGKALYAKARREKGVQVVGGAAVNESDWSVVLHQRGGITLHSIASIFKSGTIPADGEILAFATFPKPEESTAQP